jgi:hypothetical protein
MREQAQKLGFDLSVLKKVQQQGCSYEAVATAAGSGSGRRTGGGIGGGLFNKGGININLG